MTDAERGHIETWFVARFKARLPIGVLDGHLTTPPHYANVRADSFTTRRLPWNTREFEVRYQQQKHAESEVYYHIETGDYYQCRDVMVREGDWNAMMDGGSASA